MRIDDNTFYNERDDGGKTRPECPFLLKQVASARGLDIVDSVPSSKFRPNVEGKFVGRVYRVGRQSAGSIIGRANAAPDSDCQQEGLPSSEGSY